MKKHIRHIQRLPKIKWKCDKCIKNSEITELLYEHKIQIHSYENLLTRSKHIEHSKSQSLATRSFSIISINVGTDMWMLELKNYS